jgi:predicted nucleic acid-binding protein
VRVYFNTSALNRPFDDLSSDRVRLEAEAVAVLLGAVEQGAVEWVGSDYLDFEVGQIPEAERAQRVRALMRSVKHQVVLSPAVAARARDLEKHGFRGLDALHIAAAEAGKAEVLVTTDDRMIRRARRATGLDVLVVRPTEAVGMLPE